MHSVSRFLLTSLLATALLCSAASGQDLDDPGAVGSDVTITLTNGNTLTGTLIDNQGTDIVIDHDLLGRITIPRTTIRVEPPEPEPEQTGVEMETPWKGSIDAYVNGSSGNTDQKNYGANLNLQNEDADNIDSFLLIYQKETTKQAGKNTTVDKTNARYRREWKITDSRWRPFAQVETEIDEFKDYSHRTGGSAGVGYLFVEEADERFIGRLGAGATKRFGADSPDDDVIYEALVGLDYSVDFTPTNHFAVETTVYPSVNNGGDYRSFSKAEWRLDVSEESNWYFKVGGNHTYDNVKIPGNDKGDFNYYAGVGTSF
jgi:putative salt-induced outer membrane protein YdiY